MKTERSASTGPPARRATPRIALIALALSAIGLEGCQSIQSINPFRNCGGCGPLSRIGNGGMGGGLFNRNRGQIVYEEPPIILDSAPQVEVLPGAPAIIDSSPPMGSTLVPADPALITPPPSIRPPDDALELEPLPEPSGRAPQGSGSPRASADRNLGSRPIDRTSTAPASSGDSYADRMARRSSDEAPSRSGFDPAPAPGRTDSAPSGSESLRVIDLLPVPESIGAEASDDDRAPLPPEVGAESSPSPVDAPPSHPNPRPEPSAPIPAESTPPATVDEVPGPSLEPSPEPSPPPVAEPAPQPAPEPSPEPSPPPVAEPAPQPAPEPEPEPTPPPDPPAVSEPLSSTVPESQPEVGSASGIGAFYSVAPLLAGGSIPSESGWAVLADRGYRTVLDLRPVDQVRPTDFAASSRLGLRHVLLPMTPDTIDAALVSRFEEEIAVDSALPIFFCDADGSAAAALWYVHRVKVDRTDPDRARRDAERIAPIPPALLLAAQAFLDGHPIAATPAPVASPLFAEDLSDIELSPTSPAMTADPLDDRSMTDSMSDPAPVLAETSPITSEDLADDPTAAATETAASTPAETSIAEVFEDPFARPSSGTSNDPKDWGPYAALFLTILAVPLAYWSSSRMPTGFRTRVRASLAGPAQRPQSLPPTSSDA